MKLKISGLLCFLTAIVGIVVGLFVIAETLDDIGKYDYSNNWQTILLGLLVILLAVNLFLYVVWTRFGSAKSSLDKIRDENEILKMKIEQQELQKRLNLG